MRRDLLNQLQSLLEEAKALPLGNYNYDELLSYCAKELGDLDARAEKARTRAAAKREEDPLTAQLRAILTEDYLTIEDILAAFNDPEISRGKITYRLNKLTEAGEAQKAMVLISETPAKTAVAYALA